MALLKEKMTNFGIPASYWRVDMITIDKNRQEANFSLNLYLSKDAPQFIECHSVNALMEAQDKTLFEQYFGSGNGQYTDIYNTCYEYAKANEEFFKDAEDC